MCDPIAHGGHRCAFHTRPALGAAEFGSQAWDEAAADYAATPSGFDALAAEADAAAAASDLDRDVSLRGALDAGRRRREAYLDVRGRVAEQREILRPTKGDAFCVTEMLTCLYSSDKIVDRGEAMFFDEDNPVEIAAARQHIIDLDTAAEGLSEVFRASSPDLPWRQLAQMRDRNAHRYDNINRAIVWNVLVDEFPKIRVTLREYLGV